MVCGKVGLLAKSLIIIVLNLTERVSYRAESHSHELAINQTQILTLKLIRKATEITVGDKILIRQVTHLSKIRHIETILMDKKIKRQDLIGRKDQK